MKTKKTFTSTYNPRCNGTAKQVNATLVHKLAEMCNNDYEDWDAYLPYATFAYNVTVSTKTNLQPYEILYGVRYEYERTMNENTESEDLDQFTNQISVIRT